MTRTELTSYYNEFVLQLKVSQRFLTNIIQKEIQAEYRMDIEEMIKQIINLLDKNILPALEVSVSKIHALPNNMFMSDHCMLQLDRTSNDVNCSDTEEIVTNMISMYDNCSAIQIVNTYLAQTTIDLYRILASVLEANNQMDNRELEEVNESNITTDNDKQWCIIIME